MSRGIRRFIERKQITLIWVGMFAACVAMYCIGAVGSAQAQSPPSGVQQVLLPAGQRLKDADWHCWAGGSCELWVLTKPRKQGEPPETYVFQNADGTRKYVIKEQ